MTEHAPRQRSRAWLAGVAVVAVLIAGAVVVTSEHRGTDETTPTTVIETGAGDFTVEAGGGTLNFGQDGDDATLEFEGEEDGTFTFDLDGDGAITESEGGSFELTGSVPEGWPADFPVPEDAAVVRGSVVDAGALTQQSATYRTDEPAASVLAFYEGALAGASPIVDRQVEDASAVSANVSFEGQWTGFLTVTRTSEGTIVGVQLLVESAAGE